MNNVFPSQLDKPSSPLSLRVTDVWRDYLNIEWEQPEFDGGSPITEYRIEQRDAFEFGFKFLATVSAEMFSYQATKLTEGHEYYYRVFAKNAAGLCEKPAELKPAVKTQLPFGLL